VGSQETKKQRWQHQSRHRWVFSEQCAKNQPNGCSDHCQAEEAIHAVRLPRVLSCVTHSLASIPESDLGSLKST
jgi:hypothetical protein